MLCGSASGLHAPSRARVVQREVTASPLLHVQRVKSRVHHTLRHTPCTAPTMHDTPSQCSPCVTRHAVRVTQVQLRFCTTPPYSRTLSSVVGATKVKSSKATEPPSALADCDSGESWAGS